MKSSLILRTPLSNRPAGNRLGPIGEAVVKSALEYETDVKENIATTPKTGRTYRTTAIVRRGSRRNQGLGLRRRGRNLIVGYNFHRASARGESPAILSGRLINSITTSRIGPLSARTAVGAFYGLILDDPAGLDRPFFHSRAQLYFPRFVENIKAAAGFGDAGK